MSLDIPPMTDWQAFERLCRDLWSRLWNDPDAKMHGRSPQKQHGVDVYGRPGRGPEWAGLQCKLRSQIAAPSSPESADEDPEGEASRVLRGGSFAVDLDLARCASRYDCGPRLAEFHGGFRVSAPI